LVTKSGNVNNQYVHIDWISLDNVSVALPIELIDFSVSKDNGNNLLKWTTASEINNDKFEIYWSDNGTNWPLIETIDGAGNSSTELNYELLHITNSDSYYKLRQIDYDGKFEDSKIIYISNDVIDKKIHKVFDILGSDITDMKNYKGLRIIIYDDGYIEKVY